jgi:hypothetical protein
MPTRSPSRGAPPCSGLGLAWVDRARAHPDASRGQTSSPSPSSRARSGRPAAMSESLRLMGTGCRTSRTGFGIAQPPRAAVHP